MNQVPDEYCGNRCVAVMRRPDGSGSWEYYVRVGDSIKAIEKDMEECKKTYGFSYIKLPDKPAPDEKDRFLAIFEMVNISFIDLVVGKVRELNQSKTARTIPIESITLDDVLSMRK